MERLSHWQLLPDCILLHIFSFLNWSDLINVGLLCRSWYRVSCDEFLWRSLFQLEWRLPKNVKLTLPSSKSSWRKEFQRLKDCVPVEEVEVLREHTNQVLHVSFAHDGKSFASCSKDGFVKVWNAGYPVTLLYSRDMKEFNWKYTQFSQFNESDTLLLVSGVHPSRSTLGEIAVFNLEEDFNLQCKVQNRPYDIFGTWYCEDYLLSGDFHLSEHLVSSSVVWLNRASQENDCPDKAVVKQMYRFYNRNASSIRMIMVANCLSREEPHNLIRRNGVNKDGTGADASKVMINSSSDSTVPCINGQMYSNTSQGPESAQSDMIDGDMDGVLLDDREKYLIFTTGSKTYTPHQIGFKKIPPIRFQDTISVNLRERIAELREREIIEREFENLPGGAGVRLVFDEIDHYIDLHGHIIGMALSPDHRYLYVNSRPWPHGYQIMDPLMPPPIAQEIDIHIIDMTTLEEVGTMLRAHKAYTPNDECFFIFLDVSNDYVASGAEDKHGYLWDRHYSICIAKLPHHDVVNSVAFSPCNEEMLVTASDDFTLKVWRSKRLVRKLKRARKMR